MGRSSWRVRDDPDGGSDFVVARYNADGTLDKSFDGDGKVTTEVGGSYDFAYDVQIQADGKIVVAGAARAAVLLRFRRARYRPDGALDTSFGTNGRIITDFGSDGSAYGLAIQADGKIVAAGTSDGDLVLARYPTAGSVRGVVWHDLNGNGGQELGEPGLPNVTVYADQDNDGQLDANELSTQTDSSGEYVISGLAPGGVTIRQVLPAYTPLAWDGDSEPNRPARLNCRASRNSGSTRWGRMWAWS